jgi:putative NADH-flavin reductase
MLRIDPSSTSYLAEHELRRQIDRSVSRALVDGEYAQHLLADPTVLLEDRGCSPQQYLDLRSIQAESLTEFARQAAALFWLARQPSYQEDQLPLAAGAR